MSEDPKGHIGLSGFLRLVSSTIVLLALLSGVTVQQVHAQNDAPIFTWEGEVEVRPSRLDLTEGGSLSYEIRLSKQPASNGWWVRIHVDGAVYNNGVLPEKGIRWTPSVGWKFDREDGKEDSDPTRWLEVTFTALQDADTSNESVRITHEVLDADSNCPPSLHGVAPVTVRVTDDDVPGIKVSPQQLTVPEGDTRTYTVKLNTQPTAATVTVSISVPSGSDLTVDDASLTFTRDNWDDAQTVEVTAEEDHDAANDEVVLRHRGSGGDYSGVRGELNVTVTDDDEPGAMVSTETLSVPEGGNNSYTVTLDTQPAGTVRVDVTPDPSNSDLRISPSRLTFTSSNWSAKRVTVRAVEDNDAVADPTVTLMHDFSGGEYEDVTVPDVTVTIEENDDPGISLSTNTLTVREGSSRTYRVRLDAQPATDVTVAIQGGDDVDVDPPSLRFTAQTWNSWKTVTVEAEHDPDTGADPPVTVTHEASGSSEYVGKMAELTVTVEEDDRPGVTVSEQSLTVREGGSNTYTVVLDKQPSTNVDVTVTVPSDSGLSVSPSSLTLTFTPQNWDMAKTFTVTADDDDVNRPNRTVTLTHTAVGGEYSGVSVASVRVTVEDNDDPGIAVSVPRLTVPEGGDNTYTVKLDTQPTAETVTVTVSPVPSSGDVSVDKPTLTFTQQNWSNSQTVTVMADHDNDIDDDEVDIRHRGSGGDYNGVQGDTLEVTVTDDDDAAATVSTGMLSVPEGGSHTYTVVLDFQPTATVTVDLAANPVNPDLTISPSRFTFTRSNWSNPRTVTVRAREDEDAAADPPVRIVHEFSDGGYDGVTVPDVAVTIVENDTPGVAVSPTALQIPEDQTRSYTLVLNKAPSANVTVSVNVASGSGDITRSPASHTFTPTDWSNPKKVDVTAVKDTDSTVDSATLSHSVTGATEYSGISVDSVTVTIVETDRPGGNRPATGRPTITGTTVVGRTLTAHTTNIQDPDGLSNPMFHYQWIRVDGGNETNIPGANSSTYRLVNADAGTRLKVWVGFTDDENFTESATSLETQIVRRPTSPPPPPPPPPETRSQSVTFGASGYSVQEGKSVEVTVGLSLAPDSPVTIILTAKNEGGATDDDYSGVPESVVFDAGETAATFSFRAADDNVAEGTERVILGFGPLPSGVNPGAQVTAEVSIEEENRRVRITPLALEVLEGGSGTYSVVLESEPDGTVTVTVGGVAGDLTVSQETLSFTTSNWSTRQTVTVSAAEDEDSIVDAPVTLTHTVSGGGYGGVTAPNVEVTIRENDIPGVTVTPTELEVTEGSRETYTVVLDTEPAGPVAVAVGGVSGDVTVSPASLTFTPSNWSAAQTMTVRAAEDEDALDDPPVTLTHTVSGGDYAGVTAPDVVVTILDNDVPALSIEDAEASEGDGEISFAVTLNGPGSRTVRVNWATADGMATAGQDYTAREAELVFDPGETRQEVKVPLLDDTLVEPDEAFTVELSSPTGATLERSEATGMIVDNDLPLVSIAAAASSVDEGEDVRFDLTRLGHPGKALSVTVRVNATGSFLAETPPAMVSFGSGESAAVLRIATLDDNRDEADGTVEAVLVESDAYVVGDPGKAVVAVTDNDRPPAIGIESARALEIAGEIVFPITLAAASDLVVTVEWSTSDGTARAEEDYRAAGGVVTFPPGGTVENIRVILLDDVLLEEEETFTVTLVRAVNGTVGQVTATGMIEDDEGIVFRAWLTRFGRTVATQIVEAVSERLSRSLSHPSQITVGGQQLRLAFESEAGNRRQDSDLLFGSQPLIAGGGLGAPGSPGRAGESLGLYGGTLEGTRFVSRRLGGRNLLSTSSFHLTSRNGDGTGNDQGEKWAAWGRGVTTQFGGRNADLSLDGGVLTGLVGLDYERGPIMAGLAVSRSEGDGDAFAGRGQRLRSLDSDLSASLTSVYPYLRVELEERLFTWGLFGYGRGEMGATAAAGSARHDIGMTMGAVGARGSLLKPKDKNGLEVALKTDTFWVGMDLDSAIGPRITDADASRTRVLLEASCDCRYAWAGGLMGGAVDFGVRRDGGEAETGLGLEVGGVLNYLIPDRGLTVSVTARRLMAHQDDGFREWGVGGMIEYDPGTAGRGLSVRMVSSWGTAPSGTNRFWSQSVAGLNRNGYAGMEAPLTAEMDYRMQAFGGRLQMAPYADMSLVSGASGAQSYLLGWRLQFGPNIRLQLEMDLGDDPYNPLYRNGLMGPGSMLGNPGMTPRGRGASW